MATQQAEDRVAAGTHPHLVEVIDRARRRPFVPKESRAAGSRIRHPNGLLESLRDYSAAIIELDFHTGGHGLLCRLVCGRYQHSRLNYCCRVLLLLQQRGRVTQQYTLLVLSSRPSSQHRYGAYRQSQQHRRLQTAGVGARTTSELKGFRTLRVGVLTGQRRGGEPASGRAGSGGVRGGEASKSHT